MWAHLSSEADMGRLVRTWLLTLEKQGCAAMVGAGKARVPLTQSMVQSDEICSDSC